MAKKIPVLCVCTALRRAARVVTVGYDEALAEVDLTVTQYALLARIGRAEKIVHSTLAESMGMDRTTLTRSLSPLSRRGLIQAGKSDDRRQHVLELTAAGHALVERAYPLWESAQQAMLERLGKKRWRKLQEVLEAIEA